MKDYSKYVILSDMDGTLLDSSTRVSDRNKEAVRRFTDGGGRFAISTGRTQNNVRELVEGVSINTPSILYNGSALYDLEQERFWEKRLLDKDKLYALVERCLKDCPQINVQIYNETDINFVSPEHSADRAFVMDHMPCRFVDLEAVKGENWLKILLFGDNLKLRGLKEEMDAMGLRQHADYVFSSPVYLEILPLGVNKGSMLLELKEHLKSENRVFYAIGDYHNDRELLLNADVAAAPENALEEIKKLASLITPSNDEDAIAWLIEHLE